MWLYCTELTMSCITFEMNKYCTDLTAQKPSVNCTELPVLMLRSVFILCNVDYTNVKMYLYCIELTVQMSRCI